MFQCICTDQSHNWKVSGTYCYQQNMTLQKPPIQFVLATGSSKFARRCHRHFFLECHKARSSDRSCFSFTLPTCCSSLNVIISRLMHMQTTPRFMVTVSRLTLAVLYTALTRFRRGWRQTGCSWIQPRPKSSGAHRHDANTRCIMRVSQNRLRSLEMIPFDRSRTSSYSSSIVTIVVSFTVFEIKRDTGRKTPVF